MKRSILLAASGGLLAAGMMPPSALAQSDPDPDPAVSAARSSGAEAENSGQDPTKPVTRLDTRLQYSNQPGGVVTETLTNRVDMPFDLGGGWKLNTRVDLPFQLGDAPSPDNPDGDIEFGLSDLLLQALAITPPRKGWALAFGTQLILPTGTQQQFTSGKWQLAPTVAAVRQLPGISPGSFAGLLVRDTFSFAGDDARKDINVVSVEPLFNIQLPERWFVTLSPEAKFDTLDGWKLFLPFDITVGKKVSRNIVMSLQGDVAIVDQHQSYDWKMEFRVGVFF